VAACRPTGSHLLATPDGIALNVLIGAGSFGRVYSGRGRGRKKNVA
jgi:hypothetical protein